ncbi:MAG: DNA mismatch repair protein MutS [Chlamydiia bacterium]|nr:DNA mismatch repair protein MutS [Chlamydiia bacterium]
MTQAIKDTTPMMKQWHACKKEAKDALLLFRLGDFYEAFYEDAEKLSAALMITFTKRGNTPMAGIPVSTLDGYLEKLIDKGISVAIAEQTENPKEVKGIVGRAVARVITPATFTSSKDQNSGSNNFLLAISFLNKSYAIAYTDTSTAEFFFSSFNSSEEMVKEILRIHPKEILVSKSLLSKKMAFIERIEEMGNTRFLPIDPFYFDHKMCVERLHKHLVVSSLDGFGLKGESSSINACGALFSYLENDLFFDVSVIKDIKKRETKNFLSLDKQALSHLEVFYSASGPSLFQIINHTKTAMGERLLKNSLFYPFIDKKSICERQNNIKELINGDIDLDCALSGIKDIERLLTKISSGKGTPSDLYILASSLEKAPYLIKRLSGALSLKTYAYKEIPAVAAILKVIDTDSSPYFIAKGINERLDHLKSLENKSSGHLKGYEERCRADFGIKALKIGKSRSSGYYIEVSKKSLHLVPESFIRKQTLVGGERYITSELQKIEAEILSAKEEAHLLEQEIFTELVSSVLLRQKEILNTSNLIANIDLIHSLKILAQKKGYICPEISTGSTIATTKGAHPMLLQMMKQERFIPNDITLGDDASLAILTGPNMAGKSTYIKSVALLSILTQIGSFIPAESANICIVDKIFTRIGAHDDLGRGQSTFMVEMTETANILRNATSKSLIILDEIGRGTGTSDGIALAKSIATYIAFETRAKTLFATHYLELTELAQKNNTIKNIRSTVSEKDGKVTFLHTIEDGKADSSYGIFVGELSGLPRRVILDAKDHLKNLSGEIQAPVKKKRDAAQYTLFTQEEKDPIINELEHIDPNSLSPFEALEKIMQWKKSLL